MTRQRVAGGRRRHRLRPLLLVAGVSTLGAVPTPAQRPRDTFRDGTSSGLGATRHPRRLVTLDVQNAPLEAVLQAIDRQADLQLAYDPQLIPQDRRVTLHVRHADATDVLATVLEGTGVWARTTETGQTLLEKTSASPYDGRFTFVRLRYTPLSSPDGCLEADGPAGIGWGHDHPAAAQGLMTAATELTRIEAPVDTTVTLYADDPELMRYPIAYVSEPGCWSPTDVELRALREYLLKGGFLIVDDLTFSDNTPEHCELAAMRFERWVQRMLPESRLVPVPAAHPIFDGFFKLNPSDMPSCSSAAAGEIRGIYEHNDPTKRLMMVVNYTRSLGHRWRWAGGLGSGLEEGGIAYKLGLNYLMYGLSH